MTGPVEMLSEEDALYDRMEALEEQIEACELGDPPTAPPVDVLREYHAARERLAELRAAARAKEGPPRIAVLPVEPLSTETTLAFVDGPGVHGVAEVPTATYPDSPQGDRVRELLCEHDVSLGDLARALRICTSDLSGIERGRRMTDAAGWAEIERCVLEIGKRPASPSPPDPPSGTLLG